MTPDEIDNQLAELSIRLERLRSLYEQYFMGIERIEPGIARKDVERRFQQLRKTRFPTTAKRFKFQTTFQRYNSLQQYWNRTCREIENGTYRKHRKKAERRFANENTKGPSAEEEKERAAAAIEAKDQTAADLASLMVQGVDMDAEVQGALAAFDKGSPRVKGLEPLKILGTPTIELTSKDRKGQKLSLPNIQVEIRSETHTAASDRSVLQSLSKQLAPLEIRSSGVPESLRKKAGPPPAPSMRPSTKKASLKKTPKATEMPRDKEPKKAAPDLSEARMRALHSSYSEARSKINARAVSYEKLSKSIRETERKLRAKSKGRSVDFDVSIQDGKAILKPKLK